MPDEKRKRSDEEPWEAGMRHAFRAARFLGGATSLESIERATGATSRLLLREDADETADATEIPALERWSIERAEARFEVLGEIPSRLADGVILRALDRDLGRQVALKLLPEEHREDAASIRGFLEEAQIQGQLVHPGIAPAYGLGIGADGRPFLAMKLPRGEPLSRTPTSGNGDGRRSLAVFEQICQALAYAHARGVIHRNLEPESVLVGRYGEVQVLDWGRAAVGGDPGEDVRALGAMLATFLEGGEEPAEELVALSRRCLAAENRPEDAGEVAEPVSAHLAAVEERARKAEVAAAQERARAEAERDRERRETTRARWERRARLRVAAIAASVLLAVLLGGGWWALRVGEDRAAAERAGEQIAEALDHAARHEGAGEWGEALAWARKAVALASKADSLPEAAARADALLERVRQATLRAEEDDALMVRLDAIRESGVLEPFDPAVKDRDYRSLFLELSVDMDALSTEEAAALLRSRSRTLELASVIDEWAMARRSWPRLMGTDWRRLLAISREADPDEWRNKLRDLADRFDLEEIRALRATADLQRLPVVTANLLRALLIRAGDPEAAADVFRRVRLHRPDDVHVLHALGVMLRELKPPRNEEAISCVLGALALQPDSAVLWNRLGLAFSSLGDGDAAMAAYQRALELDPDFAMPHYNIGNQLREAGRHEEALAQFRKAIHLKPKNSSFWQNLGVTFQEMDRYEEAVDAAKKAIEIEPRNAAAWTNLGNTLDDLGKAEESVAALKRAVEIDPELAEGWHNLGVVLKQQGKIPKALEALEKAVDLDIGDPLAPYVIGTIYCDLLGEPEKAIEWLARSARLGAGTPREWMHHQALGIAYRKKGDLEAAEAAGLRAVKLAPTSGECWVSLGDALRARGRLDEAEETFRTGLRQAPSHVHLHLNLVSLLISRGKPEEALSVVRQAQGLRPEGHIANYNLAVALYQMGRIAEAIPHLRKSVDAQPRFVHSWVVLGISLNKTKEFDGASEAYRKALEIDPSHIQVLYNLTFLLCTCPDTSVRNPSLALSFAERAVKLDPEDPDLWRVLAMALFRAGRFDDAIEAAGKKLSRGGRKQAWGWLVVSASHASLGQVNEAREFLAKAAEWMEQNEPPDRMKLFRAEVEAILGRKGR